jgi:hypothetical protein
MIALAKALACGCPAHASSRSPVSMAALLEAPSEPLLATLVLARFLWPD